MNISQTLSSFREGKITSFPYKINDSEDLISNNEKIHSNNNSKTPLNNNNDIKKYPFSLFELDYQQSPSYYNNTINDNLFYSFKESGSDNNKLRIKFQTDIIIPEPFMEQQINAKIRIMNI